MPIVAPLGVLYPLTVEFGQTPVSMLPLLVEGRSIQGSATAPRFQIQRMLEFAARRGVKPITMEFPMTAEGLEKGLDTLQKGGMRYRGVAVAE
jgi:D-arabinose 1-dehydrogenase-like Zn-dependent alcohol dehydrogenase